jgi:large subunit ribosomal protein L24
MKARFQPKYNIKKGDKVVVIAGADKDKTNPRTVLAILPDATNPKVLVEGVAMASRHMKPNAANPQGSIIQKEMPISLSNVMLWDANSNSATKVSRDRKDGKVTRISKKSGKAI